MLYCKKTNSEILQDFCLDKQSGWFPVNETVNTFNVFNDPKIDKQTKLAETNMTVDWEICAIAYIYPNHLYWNGKKESDLQYTLKIKELYKGKIDRVNETEDFKANNLYLEMGFKTATLMNKKMVEVYGDIPIVLKGSLTSIGLLSSTSEIDDEKMKDYFTSLETYLDKENNYVLDKSKMDLDELKALFNLAYRVVGIKFKHIRNVSKSKYSDKYLDKIKANLYPEDKKQIDPNTNTEVNANNQEINGERLKANKTVDNELVNKYINNILQSKKELDKNKDQLIQKMEDSAKECIDKIKELTDKNIEVKSYPLYRLGEVAVDKSIDESDRFKTVLSFNVKDLIHCEEEIPEDELNRIYHETVCILLYHFGDYLNKLGIEYRLVLNDPTFGSSIEKLLEKNGITEGSDIVKVYNLFRKIDSYLMTEKTIMKEFNSFLEKLNTGVSSTYVNLFKLFDTEELAQIAYLDDNKIPILIELAAIGEYFGYTLNRLQEYNVIFDKKI